MSVLVYLVPLPARKIASDLPKHSYAHACGNMTPVLYDKPAYTAYILRI
jgi:hypothetical protein